MMLHASEVRPVVTLRTKWRSAVISPRGVDSPRGSLILIAMLPRVEEDVREVEMGRRGAGLR